MKSDTLDPAAERLAALGHPARLAAFRLLARRAPQGVPASEIAAALDIGASTLSAHLDLLVRAGLIGRTRHGRFIHYTLDPAGTGDLLAYLLDDCCRGRPDIAGLAQATNTAPPSEAAMPATGFPHPGFTVLFVCTGNSARSLFAEAILRQDGGGRFRAYSAGTRAFSEPHPRALAVLKANGYATDGLTSKNVSVFQGADAPRFDFVFTVCDRSANEDCPPWPGQPISAHWGVPDPVAVQGKEAEQAQAFNEAFGMLRQRIHTFIALPMASVGRLSLQRFVDDIGRDRPLPTPYA
ncbi:MAG: metalloregulator ArsR/SmtB family transcription factor [Alphaproteobacteria bacterium]|nr:metalloregulator ArsR/SmtB family transcription factor [Alphaproteobacteria bacterium]MCB9927880.1 metalloregulator ArsR/SmtB family transcription factor [Alphaproteobacteria bacterium]